MSESRVRFEVNGLATGRHTEYPQEITIRETLTFAADPAGGASLVAVVPGGLQDVEITHVELGPFTAGAGTEPIRLITGGRTLPPTTGQAADLWVVESPTGQDYYANSEACTREEMRYAPTQQRTAQVGVVIGGAALAQFVEAPAEVDAVIRYRPRFAGPDASGRSRWSAMQFLDFADSNASPPESTADLEATIRRVERELWGSGGVFTTPAGNRINACSFAAPLPEGLVYVASGDIGVGDNQIPADVASNTGDRYRNHPGVFFAHKTGGDQRSIEAIGYDADADPVSGFDGSLYIIEITAAPVASRWIWVVDGSPMEAVILHPTGSDYRRPRDIWNNVVAAAMSSPAPNQGPLLYRDSVSGVDRVFAPLATTMDLQRLQYARFVEPLGPTTTAITAGYVQS